MMTTTLMVLGALATVGTGVQIVLLLLSRRALLAMGSLVPVQP